MQRIQRIGRTSARWTAAKDPVARFSHPSVLLERCLHSHAVQNELPVKLSSFFMPTLKAAQQSGSSKSAHAGSESQDAAEQSLNLLLRGGYIRQSSSGVYTLLPLGLRMLQKLQRIIDEEMTAIGASRIEMPILLSSALWRKSGRWGTMGSELYRLQDRRGSEYVLGPTHEEEVTRLVSDEVHSGRSLPVRVYQITTKHRDEPRPRSGLLRTRAFTMKDLYTFDASLDEAAATYKQVRIAYSRIFDRILNIDPTASEASSKRPFQNLWSGWKAAEADTGAIGGHRSHEYHMEDPAGEDHLLSCSNTSACTYAANVERAISLPSARTALPHVADEVEVRLFGPSPTSIGKGAANLITGGTLHAVLIRKGDVLNEIKVNKQLASAGLTPQPVQLWSDVVRQGADWDWVERPEGPLVRFTSLEVLVDRACSGLEPEEIEDAVQRAVRSYSSSNPSASKGESTEPADKQPRLSDYFPAQLQTDSTMASAAQLSIQHVDLRTAVEGDTCASCGSGQLIQHRAVEVGHTFLLGTRYSDALDVGFAPVAAQSGQSGAGSSAEKKAAGSPARIPFQMGCYGIGVTRLIGILAQRAVRAFEMAQSGAGRATAPTASSSSPAGLLWPPSVAPFQTVIVLSTPITPDKESASESVVNKLIAGTLSEADFATAEGQSRVQGSDVLVDDRPTVNLGAKLKDADLIGSSQVIVIGKHWEKTGEVEVRTAGQAPTFVKV